MAEGALLVVLSILVVLIATINFVPFYPELEPVAFHNISVPLSGALAVNNRLDSIEILWPQLIGAETIVWFEDAIYTGTVDGKLHRIQGDDIQTIYDWKCNWTASNPTGCSRPLGLRIDARTKELYVADAFLGIYKLNLLNGSLEILFDASVPVNGKLSLIIDDMVITRSGDIYFTDASVKWTYDEIFFDCAEYGKNGRILHYNPRTKKTEVVLDNLQFPNGIELSPTEDHFVFAETSAHRLLRYYLKGSKKGQVDLLLGNLPGYPDNIRLTKRNTYWVGMFRPRFSERRALNDIFAPYPHLKIFFIRMPYLLVLPLYVTDYVGLTENALTKTFLKITRMFFEHAFAHYGIIIEVDQNGKILQSLQSPSGKIIELSHVIEHDDHLYIGSASKNGIGKLPINS